MSKAKLNIILFCFGKLELLLFLKEFDLHKVKEKMEYKGVEVRGMHMWREQQEVECKYFFLKSCLISVQTNFP